MNSGTNQEKKNTFAHSYRPFILISTQRSGHASQSTKKVHRARSKRSKHTESKNQFHVKLPFSAKIKRLWSIRVHNQIDTFSNKPRRENYTENKTTHVFIAANYVDAIIDSTEITFLLNSAGLQFENYIKVFRNSFAPNKDNKQAGFTAENGLKSLKLISTEKKNNSQCIFPLFTLNIWS